MRSLSKCIFLSFGITLFNLLLTLTVWLSTSNDSPSSQGQDTRLLLSLQNQLSPADSNTHFQAPLTSGAPKRDGTTAPSVNSLDISKGIFDQSRVFKSHMFAILGENWSQLSSGAKLCLGAQTSVDRLYEVAELVSRWAGPLSISVFTPDREMSVASKFISYLRSCSNAVARQVSFHFGYPVEHPGDVHAWSLSEEDISSMDCDSPKQVLKSLLEPVRTPDVMIWREAYPYPQNWLRNLAKAGCQSNYTYIPDIDMVPGSPTMYQDLEAFLARQDELATPCDKCAYVIPTYEISDEVKSLPTNKTQLVDLVKSKKARQFHQAVYSINQKSSDLKKWEGLPETEQMDIAYSVEKYVFKYEPLYVARASTPQFDERFIGFGMTRNTQVYEMYVAGYTFHVLNNAFTNHRGFQKISTRPDWRAKQQEQNNHKFDEFAREVSARYSADPYKMLDKLEKMNLKNVKVSYKKKGDKKKNSSKENTPK